MAEQWGPRHQAPARGQVFRWPKSWGEVVRRVILALAVWGLFSPPTTHPSTFRIVTLVAEFLAVALLLFYAGRWLASTIRARPRRERQPQADADPLQSVRTQAWHAGGGLYVGLGKSGQQRFSRVERAVLLLGPPEPVSHCPFLCCHCANSPVSA